MPGAFLQYWYTLRHLRPIQLYGRFWFRRPRRRLDRRPAPPRRAASVPWVAPVPKPQRMFSPSQFRFLNQNGELQADVWNDPARTKLWLYNLHYFDDLSAEGAEWRAEWHFDLISRWITNNPPPYGDGWEPYPT